MALFGRGKKSGISVEQQAADFMHFDLKAIFERLTVRARSSPSARLYRLSAPPCLKITKRERKPGEWAVNWFRVGSNAPRLDACASLGPKAARALARQLHIRAESGAARVVALKNDNFAKL